MLSLPFLNFHYTRCCFASTLLNHLWDIPNTKTHQLYYQYHVISIPFINGSSLCPARALPTMFKLYPASSDSPVFVISRAGENVPLMAFTVRQTTLNAYRRSGATFS